MPLSLTGSNPVATERAVRFTYNEAYRLTLVVRDSAHQVERTWLHDNIKRSTTGESKILVR